MNNIRETVRRHPLGAFVLISLLYSWGLWALMFLSAKGWVPFVFPTNWTGSFGPTFAALLVALLSEGRAGVRDLVRSIRHWRIGWRWWAFVLLGCLTPFALALMVFILLGGSVPAIRQTMLSLAAQVPILYLLVLIIGGPLGEEIGWRGFLLPRLLKSHSPLRATAMVYAMWMTWHLPLFWLPGAAQDGASIATYIVMLAGFSVVFTRVYLGTSGSLLAVLLLHTTINTFSYLMSSIAPGIQKDPLLSWLYAVMAIALAGVMMFSTGRTRSRPVTIEQHAEAVR